MLAVGSPHRDESIIVLGLVPSDPGLLSSKCKSWAFWRLGYHVGLPRGGLIHHPSVPTLSLGTSWTPPMSCTLVIPLVGREQKARPDSTSQDSR